MNPVRRLPPTLCPLINKYLELQESGDQLKKERGTDGSQKKSVPPLRQQTVEYAFPIITKAEQVT